MELVLKRTFKGPEYTIGKLYANGQYVSDTLEDTDRYLWEGMTEEEIKEKKVYGKTAIPYGTYKVNMSIVSPKFKNKKWAKPYNGKLPRLENVKGYEGVLIHVGNSPKDTLGCLLVGENKLKGMVINSTSAFNRLMTILQDHKNEEITITIN